MLIAAGRHLRGAEVLRDEPGDLRVSWRSAGPARTALLSHSYYVDELYDATVIAGTFAVGDAPVGGRSHGRRRRGQRRRQADRGRLAGSRASTDRTVVDGLVNLVGWIVQESSLAFRRFQTGLVQNYALLMLFGIFASVGVYLFVR